MKEVTAEIQPGEIRITFAEPKAGKITFTELGLNDQTFVAKGGLMRLMVEMGQFGNHRFYHNPTVGLAYQTKEGPSDWHVEFNGVNVTDKSDHGGLSTLIMLDRKKLESLVHRHENNLVVHGELGDDAKLDLRMCFIQLLEAPGS
jgi:hypothetical protein